MRRTANRTDLVLFCPFCRDAFEGTFQCPEHGLRLLPFQELPKAQRSVTPDAQLPLWEWHHGRGLVLLGALLTSLAFFLPLAALSGDVQAHSTLLELACGRSKTLWLVPAAGCAQVALLVRWRSLRGLASVRLAVLWLALLAPSVVMLTWSGASDAAQIMNREARGGVVLTPGAGVWTATLGAILSLWGGLRLGRPRKPKAIAVEEMD